MALTRHEQLDKDRLPVKKLEVQVPSLGGSVFVRKMNGTARQRYQARRFNVIAGLDDAERTKALANVPCTEWLIVDTVCDENGELIFTDDDIPKIQAAWEADAIDDVWRAANRLNFLGEEAVQEAEKNSEATPS